MTMRVSQAADSTTTFDISRFSPEDAALRKMFGNPIIDLGDGGVARRFNATTRQWKPEPVIGAQSLHFSLLHAMIEGDDPYLVKYDGSKIPSRGLLVDGVRVVWTQHRIVTGEGGKHLGTYERLVEFGRPLGIPASSTDWMLGGNAQWMVITPKRATNAEDNAPPPHPVPST